MPGKTIDSPTPPISADALLSRMQNRYKSVPLVVTDPDGPMTVHVAMLKSGERERIITLSRFGTPDFNASVWNRLTVAYGLVEPRYAEDKDADVRADKIAEILRQFTDDFILPIAQKIWDLTNAHRDTQEKAADEPVNFLKGSGSSSGSLTEPTLLPTSSSRGTTSA